MGDRLAMLKSGLSGQTKLKRPAKKTDYSEYISEITSFAPPGNSINIAFFSDAPNIDLDNLIADRYSVANMTIYSSDAVRNSRGPEADNISVVPVLETFKKSTVPARSLVIALITTEEFFNKIKSIATITLSRVIIFTPFEIADAEVSSRIGEISVYKFNQEKELKTISVASSSMPPVPVPAPVKATKAVTKKFELPSRLKLPNLPEIARRPKGLILDTPEWNQAFREYIQSIIRSIVLNEETTTQEAKENLIKDLTEATPRNGNENMLLIWRLAFTHESENPDSLGNYDQLEAIGDRHLGAVFKEFTRSKYPRITDDELNEYASRYMSEEFQVPMGMKLHFLDWIIMDSSVKPSEKICEDIFESFCGTLVTVGDKIMGGLGYLLVRNIIRGIFSKFDYDPSLKYGKPITILSQGFRSHRWGDANQQDIDFKTVRNDSNGTWTSTYRLTNNGFISYVQSELGLLEKPHMLPRDFTGIVISVTGKTVDEAKEAASIQTLKAINELGITTEHIVERDLRRVYFYRYMSDYRDKTEAAYNKAATQNIEKLYIKKIKNVDDDDSHYMLIGISRDSVSHKMLPLYSFDKNVAQDQAFTKILEAYLAR